MKYYSSLLDLGCFTREQLIQLTGTAGAANMVIYEYQKKGLIEKVKRDFYVVISMETRQPILSRYQIGANLFSDACVTHHSAFEVYGYGSQVFYECFVATDRRFTDFEYDGVTYHRIERKPDLDVVTFNNVRVTSLEQTAVDSIRDFEKIAGLEEVLRCLMLVPSLNEKKILECLEKNKNGFLYQKCGFLFEELKQEFRFSEKFFMECERNSSGAKRYLIKESQDTVFNERWKLYVPMESLDGMLDKGVGDYDAMG
jgi:predicted transcriptional regulator of viral defense system